MKEFVNTEYYGNTVGDWIIAFAIIIASMLFAKVVFFLISKFIKKITSKTKSKIDDIIIDKFEEPAVFGIIILGIWMGFETLNSSESIQEFIGHTYYFLVTINIAWFISRLVDALLEEYIIPLVEKTETDLDDQLLPLARKAIRISIWILAIIIGLNNAGYDVKTLLAGLGLGGLAFALAAKESLSHLFGGIVLFTDKPFMINDRILTNGFDGNVQEIGIRSTRIRTLDGREVTIPNADIANSSIVNISSEPDRKITVDLGLIYNTSHQDIKRALGILQEITNENTSVDETRTVTAFTAFGDFSLNVRFIYYIKKEASVFGTMTEINLSVLEKFNANKLEFAFPTQTIYSEKTTV